VRLIQNSYYLVLVLFLYNAVISNKHCLRIRNAEVILTLRHKSLPHLKARPIIRENPGLFLKAMS